MATIDNLTLEITANTNRAVDNLTKLSEALSALKSASKGISSTNLQKVADAFSSVKIAVSGISLSSIRRVERLADALNMVASVDASNLRRVSNAISRMGITPNGSQKTSTAQALQLPAVAQSFEYIPQEVKNLPAIIPSNVETGLSAVVEEEKEFYGTYREITDEVGQNKLASKFAYNMYEMSYQLKTMQRLFKAFATGVAKKSFQQLGEAVQKAVKPLQSFVRAIGRIAFYRAIRGILKAITQGIREGIQNLALYSKAMNELDSAKANHTMSELATAFLYLKNSIATALMPLIQALVPAIKRVVEVAVQALNIINQVISALQGKSTFTKAKIYWVDYADSLDKTTGSAKKLHKQLAGFDELNNLTTNAGGGSASGLDPTQMFEEAEIDNKVLDTIEKIKKIFEEIKDLIPVIGAGILAWTIGSKLAQAITALGWLTKAGALKLTLGLTLMGVGFTLEGMSIADIIMNGLDVKNFGKAVGGALLASIGSFLTGSAFATIFGASFLTGIIGGIGTAIAGIGLYIAGVWDSVVNGIDWLSAILTSLGATLGGTGIGAIVGAIIGALGGPIGAGVGALIGAGVGLAIGVITDLVILAVQHWEEITTFLSETWTSFINFEIYHYEKLFKSIKGHLDKAVEKLTVVFEKMLTDGYNFGVKVGQILTNIMNDVTNAKNYVVDTVVNFVNTIGNYLSQIPIKINQTCTLMWNTLNTIPSRLGNLLTLAFNKVSEWGTKVKEWVKTEIPTIVNSIGDMFSNIPQVLEIIGKNMITALWNGIVSMGTFLTDHVKNFFGVAWDSIKDSFKGLGEGSLGGYINIPQFAGGGFVGGDLFIANERGAEMVGSINGRTAVANNDQITEAIAQATYRAMSEALQENSMNITIVGDADGMFKVMRNKSRDYRRETGRSAFA